MSRPTQVIFHLRSITVEIEVMLNQYNDPAVSVIASDSIALALLNQYFYGNQDIDTHFQYLILPSDVKAQLFQTVFTKINQYLQHGFITIFPHRRYSYTLSSGNVIVSEGLPSSMLLEVVTVRHVDQRVELTFKDTSGFLNEMLPEESENPSEYVAYVRLPDAQSSSISDLEPREISSGYVPERLRTR